MNEKEQKPGKKKLNLKVITDKRQFMSKEEIYLREEARKRADEQKRITEETIKKKAEAVKKQAEVQKRYDGKDTEEIEQELRALQLKQKVMEGEIAKLQLEGTNGDQAKKLEDELHPINDEIDDLEWEVNRRFAELDEIEKQRRRKEDRVYPIQIATMTFAVNHEFEPEIVGEEIAEHLYDEVITFNVDGTEMVILTEDEKDNLEEGLIGIKELRKIKEEQED